MSLKKKKHKNSSAVKLSENENEIEPSCAGSVQHPQLSKKRILDSTSLSQS